MGRAVVATRVAAWPTSSGPVRPVCWSRRPWSAELAEAIARLAADPELRMRLGAAGRAHFEGGVRPAQLGPRPRGATAHGGPLIAYRFWAAIQMW